ncbi:MAG: hypothetical protein ACREFN_09805, partial [Acetobacteraceae bacterium]
MNSLFDAEGSRKYLTETEPARFLAEADRCERKVQAFCHTLARSGCRISEALALTPQRVDPGAANPDQRLAVANNRRAAATTL